jgi:hypothetical protein
MEKLNMPDFGDNLPLLKLPQMACLIKCIKLNGQLLMFSFNAGIILFFLIAWSGIASAETFDIFVLAGQSNMQGFQGDANHYPIDINKDDQNIPFYWVDPESRSNGAWLTLQAQPGIFSAGHFGPEITFARKLYEAGFHPAIFKYSAHGTSLANNWKTPKAGGLYDQMVNELQNAVKKLAKPGVTVNIKAFLWIQGESDAESKDMSDAYESNLQTLIGDFRENVAKNPKLPIILGVDEQNPSVKQNPEVVNSQKRLAANNANIKFTSMIGLQKADSTHLSPDGLQFHGNRLFDAYKDLTKNSKKTGGLYRRKLN